MNLKEKIEKFHANYEISPDGCWNWTGTLSRENGYGVFRFRKFQTAHRFSYFIHRHDIKDGFEICHKCHNRRCVNPRHLYMGTHQQNMSDRRGRNENRHMQRKLTLEQVKSIKHLRASGLLKISETGRRLNVSRDTIYRILNGATYRFV